MTGRRHRKLLATAVLGERGGGIGQVSQLLWQAMQDEWAGRTDIVTLLRNGHASAGISEKWRFGLELARRQFLDRPDWILFSHVGLARAERYVPARFGCPYAVFLHGIECWSPLPEADREVLGRASLRVANSRYTATRAMLANPTIGPVEVCPLALPGSVPPPPCRPAGDTPPTVLVVGRISASERYKGHEQLIQAWPQVRSVVPGARLVIAGDGDDVPRLRALARGLGQGAIEFTGFLTRSDLERRYSEASLFALPSRGEGFGLVYLEAMAAGLPCVGSIHDAASEVVADGETGILVDPDRVDDMGAAIARLLRQPARMRSMGDAGRARLLSTFSFEQFRGRIAFLLRNALENRPSLDVGRGVPASADNG